MGSLQRLVHIWGILHHHNEAKPPKILCALQRFCSDFSGRSFMRIVYLSRGQPPSLDKPACPPPRRRSWSTLATDHSSPKFTDFEAKQCPCTTRPSLCLRAHSSQEWWTFLVSSPGNSMEETLFPSKPMSLTPP